MTDTTERATYTIGAVLTLTSPLMIAGSGTQKLNPETWRYDSGSGAVQCSQVQTLALMTPETGQMHRVPVIAANNIAGRLRRHGARIVLNELAAKGQKVSIGTYSGLMCGAISGNPAVEDVEFAEYSKALAHPYMGLFGGGPRWLRRNLRVHNALPDLPATHSLIADLCIMRAGAGQGAHWNEPVPASEETLEDAPRARSPRSLLGYWLMNRNDDLNDLVDIAQASTHIEDFRNQMAQRQQRILAEKNKDDGKSKDAGRDITKTESFTAIEFVVPGTRFMLQFELVDVTPAQLGLFLQTLDSFARTERLGCMTRNGFGCFKIGGLIVQTHAGASTRHETVQTNELADLTGTLSNPSMRSAWIAPLLSQWEQARQSIDAQELEHFFRPGQRSRAARTKQSSATATTPATPEAQTATTKDPA